VDRADAVPEPMIIPVDDKRAESAVGLLHRFFQEEGFAGDRTAIAANLGVLRRDPHHWAAIAVVEGHAIGIVTVTTALYVEWGRLGEIGDLYVLPEARRRGIARALVRASLNWCRAQGCSAVAVTITAEGEAAHGLSRFYARFGFEPSGRTISVLRL
jgi:GNAT superfamily N-acetyltransferase